MAREWAKCKTCGGEVWFDAYADYSGETVSVFDETYCQACDGPVGWDGYVITSEEPPG